MVSVNRFVEPYGLKRHNTLALDQAALAERQNDRLFRLRGRTCCSRLGPCVRVAGRFCRASVLSILPDAESRRFACVFACCEGPQQVLIDGLRRSAVV